MYGVILEAPTNQLNKNKMQKVNSNVVLKETKSSLSPSQVFPDFQIRYPKVVVEALRDLYDESNKAFTNLVEANREWSTDYRYCFIDGNPVNQIVQIDMCGLTDILIFELQNMQVGEVKRILRGRIFEMENSWALYQILRSVYENNGVKSFYGEQTESMLNSLRNKFGMPIALLAVTQDKYDSMKASEFGKNIDELLCEKEIFELSGFDNFFGPNEFVDYLSSNNGECGYLLYVRASDPVEKLKHPGITVEHPLLSIPHLRKIIKENSITLNIDNPEWHSHDLRRINDAKWYMPSMSMGFLLQTFDDFNAKEFVLYLENHKICFQDVLSGKISIRVKPAQGTYGCYGHVRGRLTDGDFRKKVKNGLKNRGPHIVQIEREPPTVYNIAQDSLRYAYIDRVFFGNIDGISVWMGGHREFLPYDSNEVKSGRLHGNWQAVFGEIV